MDAERLVDAFREALAEPPSIAERIAHMLYPGERMAAEMTADIARLQRRMTRPRGRWASGALVTDEQKQAAFAMYEQRRDAFYAEHGAARSQRPRVVNEMRPGVPPGRVCRWW